MGFFESYFDLVGRTVKSVDTIRLESAAQMIEQTRDRGGKLIVVGNGGSAAMASHVAVDFTKNAGVRAINFNEADLITCFVNDFGADHWVEKAIELYADPEDLVICISTSGRSLNIVNAARKSRELKLPVITFSGSRPDNPLRALGSVEFWVDSHGYNIVEMTHHVWLLALVDRVIGQVEYPATR